MRKTAGGKKREWQIDNGRDELSCLREMCEPSESEVKDYYAKNKLESQFVFQASKSYQIKRIFLLFAFDSL